MSRPGIAGPGGALLALGGGLAVTVIVTGLLAPVLATALQDLGAQGATLAEVCVRTLQLTAIAVTFALLALVSPVAPGRMRDAWGVPERRRLARRLAAGLAIGIVSIGLVCGLLFALGVRLVRPELETGAGAWAGIVAGAALSAVAVALLEEFWFRGGLHTLLQRIGGVHVAVWGGAALYAAAHFLEPAADVHVSGPFAGFVMLGHLVGQVFEPVNVDSLAALLAAGVALAVARVRDGDVALAIGIHAGWVLTIKIFKKFTYVSTESGYRALAGHYDDLIGWLAAGVLALLAVGLWWRMPARGVEVAA